MLRGDIHDLPSKLGLGWLAWVLPNPGMWPARDGRGGRRRGSRRSAGAARRDARGGLAAPLPARAARHAARLLEGRLPGRL